MNIEVDNEILASVIDARFGIKPQLSSNIEKANFKQTIFFPEDKLKSNTFNSVPLDTYGIINKSKLFTREPITGEQISYLINDNGYTVKDNNPDIKIETTDYKIFYRFEINEIQHKYCSSIFTNLKFKKINIVFPNSSTIHFFSENISLLKKYIKKFDHVMVQKYLNKVQEGDKRVFIINGKVKGAIRRLPRKGSILSNISQGGIALKTKLNSRELKISKIVASSLKKSGIFFAGIDLVGGYLIGDINVTSPTGLPQFKNLTGKNLAIDFWNELEKLK